MKYLENNEMVLKEDIEKKLEVVYRQMKHCKYDDWIPKVRERVDILFSSNTGEYSKAIRQIDGLISNIKAWDEMVRAPEDEFIEEFKNFDEYYHFARELVRDINKYNEERLKKEVTK